MGKKTPKMNGERAFTEETISCLRKRITERHSAGMSRPRARRKYRVGRKEPTICQMEESLGGTFRFQIHNQFPELRGGLIRFEAM
ncbi:hypothetical protein GOBAR_DD29109 [Gossypium barbadense]|nr:hypothetical protein GOBAR_DD29109 [Gossypium barbadense]